MPDTGEDREIRQRVNAKEAESKSKATKMRQTMESAEERNTTRRAAKKKKNESPVNNTAPEATRRFRTEGK